MKKGVLIPIGIYLLTALIIFIGCAALYRTRISATAPTDEGIRLAMENGEITRIDDTTIYDYSTDTERYILTETAQDESNLFYSDRRTGIGVLLVNGEVTEWVDLRSMQPVTEYNNLTDTGLLMVLAVIVLGEIASVTIYWQRMKKE